MAEHAAVARFYGECKAEAKEKRGHTLRDLLIHALERVPFYRGLSRSSGFRKFPVISKGIILKDRRSFMAEGFTGSSLKRVTTSGSSGEPFECYHDAGKVRRKLADLLYYNGLAGYRVGMRHMLIRVTPKGRIKQWLQNEIWVDPTRWDADLLSRVRLELLRGKIKVAIGYPSVMADIAEYCIARGDTPEQLGLAVFIGTSELMTRSRRDLIAEAFRCRVVSRYATEELGIIGQTDEDCEVFQVNQASHLVEVLRLDSDSPAAPGSLGRVVVTDLFSRAMPLIRYDTGDIAIAESMAHGEAGVATLRSLEGKQTDVIYDVRGERVAPLTILVALKDSKGFHRFQFAQRSACDYALRVCPEDAEVDPSVQEKLLAIMGAGARLQVQRVSRIARLRSGKCPVVVNEMTK
jgi:phenylacetate-CoA ligase